MRTVRSIRRALALTLATGLWTATLVTPDLAAGACAVPGADEPAVAAARAAVQQECDCAGSADARSWRVCVKDSLAGTAGEGLSAGCARLVRKLDARIDDALCRIIGQEGKLLMLGARKEASAREFRRVAFLHVHLGGDQRGVRAL